MRAPDGIIATVFAVECQGEGTYLYVSVDGNSEQAVVCAAPGC